MNPSAIDKAEAFSQAVLLPTLTEIQEFLEEQGYYVLLTSASTLDDEIAIALLAQMSPNPPLEGSAEAPLPWIDPLLYVKTNIPDGVANTNTSQTGQYCLSLQLTSTPTGEIGITPLSAYTYIPSDPSSTHIHPFSAHSFPQSIQNIEATHITTSFLESFERFEAHTLDLTPAPEPLAVIPTHQETIHIPPVSEQPTVPSIHEPPIVLPELMLPELVLPESIEPVLDKRAAQAQREVTQRQVAKAFLSSFKLTGVSLDYFLPIDLERISELSHQIEAQRPQEAGDYQTAYDCLLQQAAMFALSLKPSVASEFADYLALYRSIIEGNCTSLQQTSDASYESIFVSQVKAFGEPDAPNRVPASFLLKFRILFQDIAVQFGRPDALGQRDWIGISHLNPRQSIEAQIRMIQQFNDQRQLRFNSLSWGVLQVCHNASSLPQSEHHLGRNLVQRYLRSLQLTVNQPMGKVESQPRSDGGVEFCFSRNILGGSKCWRASVRVGVTQPYDEVVLHSYSFDEL
jgi:hypothetical protein